VVSSTNKTNGHDITEILLKEALNTITLTPTEKRGVIIIWSKLKLCGSCYAMSI